MRRIFEPQLKRITSYWRFRYNNELYKLFDDVRVSKIIKLKRLQWAGYVECMDEEKIPKIIQYGEIGSRRPIAKPRRRWTAKEDSRKILKLTG